jgi:hypothetical protein
MEGQTFDPAIMAEAAVLWQSLRALPAAEAEAQVLALRKAALACTVEDRLMSSSTR